MARTREQEDVFKPLNDSPATESEQSQRSGRGWEVKIGMLALALVVGATGYVAYSQLRPGDDADEAVAGSSRLQLDTDADKSVANQVVPAHVPVGVEPAPAGDTHALVMTQWNAPEKPEQADAWTSSESVADQVPTTLEAAANQSYAAGYGGDDLSSQAAPPTEKTFAPMPNPNNFTAGITTPVPSDPLTANPGTAPESPYRDRVAAMAPTPAYPDYPSAQSEATAPAAKVPYEPSATGAGRAYDFGAAPRSDTAPVASAPAAETPAAPAYTPASESYAPAYTTPGQGIYAGPTAGPSSYPEPAPASLSTPESYPSYARPTTTKTHADYAGLSDTGAAEQKAGADVWQEPSVVPVNGNYSARPNDNFYTISKKVYGSGAYFEALARYNKDKYPKANQIRIGDVVQTPPVETLEGRYPELCPKPEHRDAAKRRSASMASRSLAGRRVYVVQEGDNLFDIARFELGARAKVADLIELNRDILGDHINYLTPGMRLMLPETDVRGPTVTQAPTNTLR